MHARVWCSHCIAGSTLARFSPQHAPMTAPAWDALLRPAPLPSQQAFRALPVSHRPLPRRKLTVVAGEGRSANRTKWASGDLAGSAASAAVLERPPPSEQPVQQDASELVRAAGRRGTDSLREAYVVFHPT